MDPANVASEYFSRIRAGDISVVDLFHNDATLIGLGTKRIGRDAIHEFYQGVIERAGPSPRSAGPLLADESRVAAEIVIEFPGANAFTRLTSSWWRMAVFDPSLTIYALNLNKH
jgi:hypothetical protein